MTYPFTPFKHDFNTEILTKAHLDHACQEVTLNSVDVEDLLKWLCLAPSLSSLRVNTIVSKIEDILELVKKALNDKNIEIEAHPMLKEVVIIHNIPNKYLDLSRKQKEVIIDVHCATSVLRGANIFAPGVIGMQTGIKLNDQVSIYVDIAKKCKKGSKVFNLDKKIFVGNGIVKMTRKELFGENIIPHGIAVEMFSNTSGCPALNLQNFPTGACLLQNLPSIICAYAVNPQPNEVILDMCAAPGHKTTHISALMENKGILIALDKIPTKIKQLEKIREDFKANFKVFLADSTKILLKTSQENAIDFKENSLNCPPYLAESFDKILLDAPCSALGKRPQLSNESTEKMIKSYVPLQRKLFENAAFLLKSNGRLVYSTCTITLAENEGMVAWALNKFKFLKLIPPELKLGSKGWDGTSLNEEEVSWVQRFDHRSLNSDSVGFFIACFLKIEPK